MPLAGLTDADVFTIIGLPCGSRQITAEKLKAEYESITITVTESRSDGTTEVFTATGVKLDNILRSLCTSQKKYPSIVISAPDGYMIEFSSDFLSARDIVVSYEINGEPQSPQIVVPEESGMYHIKFVKTIELMSEGARSLEPVGRIFILETMLAGLESMAENYEYKGGVGKALPIKSILGAYAVKDRPDFVTLKAFDGLLKNERYETVSAQYIKYTGISAPMFIGPNLPAGMRMKRIETIRLDKIVIASVTTAQAEIENPDGVPVADLFKMAGMAQTTEYFFTSADGYRDVVDAADIEKGVVKADENGSVTVIFAGLANERNVKNLLSVNTELQ